MSGGRVEPLRRDSFEQAARTLGRAFTTDPMFTWLFPDAATRPAAVHRLNRLPLEYGARYGRVTASHEGRGVAIWIPPGVAITVPRLIRCGLLGVPFHTGLASFMKFLGANDAMERIHHTRMPEPHWYLMVVGVDPEMQNRGLGTALVTEGLAHADQTGARCYLETSDERNVAFYRRLGFEVLASARLGADGPPAWAMRREGRSSARVP